MPPSSLRPSARSQPSRPLSAPADVRLAALALVDVAGGVAAPMLAAYVLWILEDAAARGLGRVYFLARDGQVLYEIARRLAPRRHRDRSAGAAAGASRSRAGRARS